MSSTITSTLDKIDGHIQELVSPQQYHIWFKTLKLVSISNDEITFSLSSDFLRNWVNSYYIDVINKAVFLTTNKSPSVSIITVPPSIDSQALSDSSSPAFQRPFPNNNSNSPSHIIKNSSSLYTYPQKPSFSDNILNDKYLFDNFIVGPSNQLAYASSHVVAKAQSREYNPLFIHGAVGLGKTHLLQAICHKRLEVNPNIKFLYLSFESFLNQFLSALENRTLQDFRQKHRHIDLFLVDDIHLIANKERTTEEFFHTFNFLYNCGRQIVLSSYSPPSEIPSIEERLISRFKWGLVAEIDPPSFETRCAILKSKASNMCHRVPDDVIHFLAENINTNIRELEGAITKVIGYSVLTESTLDLSIAQFAMKDVINKSKTNITIDDIFHAVTEKFRVKIPDLQSKKRQRSIALPRQICMYITKKRTTLSLQEIGGYFGGRDHTTVLYAINKIKEEIKNNDTLSKSINDIMTELSK